MTRIDNIVSRYGTCPHSLDPLEPKDYSLLSYSGWTDWAQAATSETPRNDFTDILTRFSTWITHQNVRLSVDEFQEIQVRISSRATQLEIREDRELFMRADHALKIMSPKYVAARTVMRAAASAGTIHLRRERRQQLLRKLREHSLFVPKTEAWDALQDRRHNPKYSVAVSKERQTTIVITTQQRRVELLPWQTPPTYPIFCVTGVGPMNQPDPYHFCLKDSGKYAETSHKDREYASLNAVAEHVKRRILERFERENQVPKKNQEIREHHLFRQNQGEMGVLDTIGPFEGYIVITESAADPGEFMVSIQNRRGELQSTHTFFVDEVSGQYSMTSWKTPAVCGDWRTDCPREFPTLDAVLMATIEDQLL
jgi:hypothetical protein